MNFAANYYRLILPIPSGMTRQCHYSESQPAQHFINEQAPTELFEACPKTAYINRWNKRLWQQALNNNESMAERTIAVTVLRCYISWCLEKTAHFILKKYKSIRPEKVHLDEVRNLLLEDTDLERLYFLELTSNCKRNKIHKINHDGQNCSDVLTNTVEYVPLSFKALETWNPNLKSASSLQNWTTRKALDSNIMRQLGIDRHTPWYRLIKVSQRRLKLFSDYDQQYIKAFQQVYNGNLEQNRKSYNSRFPSPSQAQLAAILEQLKRELKPSDPDCDTNTVQDYLRELADEIRRLYFKIPTRRQLLLDAPVLEIDHGLELAVENALGELGGEAYIIQNAVRKIFNRHKNSVQSNLEKHDVNFREIIYLYYCAGLSQANIARQINRDQSQVSRLLSPRKYLKQTYVECIDRVIGCVMQDFYFSDDPNIVADLEHYTREIFSRDFEQANKIISSRNIQGDNINSVYFQAICSLYS